MIGGSALLGFATVAPFAVSDIPWPEAKERLAKENAALAKRPQGHDGTYFVICTLYYTPLESGITAERGFDVTPVKPRGLRGHSYPREFLAAVKMEGVGRIVEPVKDFNYIAYDGNNSYRFVREVHGRGANVLVARESAAARRNQLGFPPGTEFTISDPDVLKVFDSASWKIVDTGGGLKRWQVDLYWGEDEPLGPGKLLARPKGTTFEYGYSEVTIKPPEEKKEMEEPTQEPDPTATPTPENG